jgi:hypothetical protein
VLSKLGTSERFLRAGCRVIDNLCLTDKEVKEHHFSGIADDLINFFLKFLLSELASLTVLRWSTNTILSIIEVANNPQAVLKYLSYVIENLDNIQRI